MKKEKNLKRFELEVVKIETVRTVYTGHIMAESEEKAMDMAVDGYSKTVNSPEKKVLSCDITYNVEEAR